MSNRMVPVPVRVETWKIEELIDATLTKPSGDRQITIPGFQRRLAWPEEKRKGLITSIKKGYPFGSLLVFKDRVASNRGGKTKEYYKLIDGLQRTQALKYYDRYPNRFFDASYVENELVTTVALRLDRKSDCDIASIRNTIVSWVQGKSGFSVSDGWETSELVKVLVTDILDLHERSYEYPQKRSELQDDVEFRSLLVDFLESVSALADISKIEVPVIVFAGESRELEKIFTLLNTKGEDLTKYEILAAAWLDKVAPINSKEIRDAIWIKYEKLASEGFTLDVAEQAPDETARRKRPYNLFEFLFGVGQRLPKNFERLFKPISDDKPNPVAFNLVCACFGLHVGNMKSLPELVEHLDRSKLLSSIEDSVNCVDRALDPVLLVKEAGKDKYPIYHKEFQIISAIATVFQIKYAINDLSLNVNSQTEIDRFCKNFLMHYLYDILVGDWSGSGDSTLHETVKSKRYVNSAPSKLMWERALEVWFDKHSVEFRHDRRYVRQDKDVILLLKYIYAHRLNLVENARTYHVEHLIPVKQLTDVMEESRRWPINTIGNLGFLQSTENLKKGSKNYAEYLQEKLRASKLTQIEYREAIADYDRQLVCNSEWFPTELNEETFKDFLGERFRHLKNEFIKVWQGSKHISD